MLSAPHATGKSTTAKALVDKWPTEMKPFYVSSHAGIVAKRMSFDLNKEYTPDQVCAYQDEVLNSAIFLYKCTGETLSVFDRSPLDFLAYSILALKDKSKDDWLVEYQEKCLAATVKYCGVLFIPECDLTQPYEEKENRPKFDESQIAYRTNYLNLIVFYATTIIEKVPVIVIPTEYQYERRVEFILRKLKVTTK